MVSQFINLTDRQTVRADHIVRVYIESDYLMVQTLDGDVIQADVGYGQRVWQAKSQLLERIDAAMAARTQN